MRLRFTIKSLFLATCAVALVVLCSLPTDPLTYRDGVDKAEAKRVFEIAKPLIDKKLGGDARDRRYRISRFDYGWIVMAGHKTLRLAPSGWEVFFVNEDGKLVDWVDSESENKDTDDQ